MGLGSAEMARQCMGEGSQRDLALALALAVSLALALALALS